MKWKMNRKREHRLANALKSYSQRQQRQWATWMNRRTAGLTKRTWLLCLVLFVIVSCSLSIYVAVHTLKGSDGAKLSVSRLRVPKRITETGEPPRAVSKPPSEIIVEIRSMRHYMDSLQRDRNGKSIYDSLMRCHPGFMDSLRKLESYYHIENQ